MRRSFALRSAVTAVATGFAVGLAGQGTDSPRLDVVFCVDTTGSMQDEIDVVKEKMREMVANIAAGDPAPDVRFGLVIYRDRGDEYVTKRYPLTRDIDAVVADINDIVADAGGDYPESLNEALHVAVREMEWDTSPDAGRVLFLIADAPPHTDYEEDYNYAEEATAALEKGIVIDTIGCSGLEERDQPVFEEIASITTGSFELLTYMREYVDEEGRREIVVSAGSEHYALADDAGYEEWREGAKVLEGRGRAEKLSEADARDRLVAGLPAEVGVDAASRAAGGPGAAPAGPRGPAGPAGAAGMMAPGAPAETPATAGKGGMAGGFATYGGGGLGGGVGAGIVRGAGVAAKGQPDAGAENNLDRLLTRQVQLRLAQQGVRFKDQPYLASQEWRGGSCAQTSRKALVSRNQSEWEQIWQLVAEVEGPPTPPTIDFTRDMVLAAFGGETSAGRSIRIADVWEDEDGLHARVERGVEDPDARSPYHIIVVNTYPGRVVWK